MKTIQCVQIVNILFCETHFVDTFNLYIVHLIISVADLGGGDGLGRLSPS